MFEGRSIYKRWLKRLFIIVAALLAGVALFNLLVDGVGVFRFNKGLKYAATNLLQGRMVAGPLGIYDERELQKLVVQQYPSRRDIIAIGSSRTLQLRKRFLKGPMDFFNHSVAGVCMEDYMAILGLYRSSGLLPKTVILAIDPWIFNRENGLPAGWKILDRYYREMSEEIDATGPRSKSLINTGKMVESVSKVMQLVNLEYTLQNWGYFRKGKRLYVTDRIDIDDFVREPDGSLHFPGGTRSVKEAEKQDGPGYAMPEQFIKNFDSLYGTEMFEGLVRYLTVRDVKVIFLLPPLHPTAYQSCIDNPKCQVLLKVEPYLRNLALRFHARVIGSLDPRKYGFTSQDFSDTIHGREIVMKTLLQEFQ
jgi:hypothetical protein